MLPSAMACTAGRSAVNVYTLANDYVIKDLAGLLSSFRSCNPDGTIHVIPWDENIQRTRDLCHQYDARLIDENLSAYDNMGAGFTFEFEKGRRIFRKFFAFHHASAPFLFLDADCIVLSEISFLFDVFSQSKKEILFYASSGKDRNFNDDAFKEYAGRVIGRKEGYNAAFFLSLPNLFPFSFLSFLALRMRQFESLIGLRHEQSFLSYCVTILAIKAALFSDLVPDLCAGWDVSVPIFRSGDHFVFGNRPHIPISIIHSSSNLWASGPNHELYASFISV